MRPIPDCLAPSVSPGRCLQVLVSAVDMMWLSLFFCLHYMLMMPPMRVGTSHGCSSRSSRQ